MANKAWTEKLEVLLDWEREGDRLPKRTKLFACTVSDTCSLVEVSNRTFALSFHEGDKIPAMVYFKNESLVSLGLAILEAQKFVYDRYVKKDE